jgi:hypothetical protein
MIELADIILVTNVIPTQQKQQKQDNAVSLPMQSNLHYTKDKKEEATERPSQKRTYFKFDEIHLYSFKKAASEAIQ